MSLGGWITGALILGGLSAIFGKETPEQYEKRHREMRLGLRETPEQYRARHERNEERARQRQQSRNAPYTASDGRTYSHKETPEEYAERKRRNSRW